MKDFGLIIYYAKSNRYSFNALLGAFETFACSELWDIEAADMPSVLFAKLRIMQNNHPTVVVAISYRTAQISNITSIMTELSLIRHQNDHRSIFVAGGPHPTGCPQHAFAIGFDVVVYGEGEETFGCLLQRICSGEDYSNVAGTVVLSGESARNLSSGEPALNLSSGEPAQNLSNGESARNLSSGEPARNLSSGEPARNLSNIAPALNETHNSAPDQIINNTSTHNQTMNSSLKFNPQRTPCNLNQYPPYSLKMLAIGPLEITRGCPHICGFCQTPYIFGTQVRHRSIENICILIEQLLPYGLKDLRFITPNLLSYGSPDGKIIHLTALQELFQSIRNLVGSKCRMFLGTFPSEIRPEFITPDTIALLKEFSANDNITLGAQSGSERMLQCCHRGHTIEAIYNAVKLAKQAGFRTNVDFIFGLPNETVDDMKATLKLIHELMRLGAKIHAHTFMPLPQTAFKNAVRSNEIVDGYIQAIQPWIGQGQIFGSWQTQNNLPQEY